MPRSHAPLAAMLLALAVPLATQAATPSQGDAAQGARSYRQFGCAACHGTTGAGGGWQGPRLAPSPIPVEAFLAQLREPADKMPRYRESVLGDAQAHDIYAYLRSIRPGRPAREIEILNR